MVSGRRGGARAWGGAPNIERGTRDGGLLLCGGAGTAPADVRPIGSWLRQGLDEASYGQGKQNKGRFLSEGEDRGPAGGGPAGRAAQADPHRGGKHPRRGGRR